MKFHYLMLVWFAGLCAGELRVTGWPDDRFPTSLLVVVLAALWAVFREIALKRQIR